MIISTQQSAKRVPFSYSHEIDSILFVKSSCVSIFVSGDLDARYSRRRQSSRRTATAGRRERGEENHLQRIVDVKR